MSEHRLQQPLLAASILAASILALGGASACTVAATEADVELANRCADAAAAIEACDVQLPAEFFEACEHDPTPESIAIIEDLAAAQCEEAGAGGKADGWREGFFVSACTPTLHAGYLTNRYRNGPGQKLSARDRDRLRPHFGGLVDRVRVHYNAKLNTRWQVAGHELQYGGYTAQAYGYDLYIRDSYRPGNNRQLALVAHEIQHSRQRQRAGSLHKSLKNYCREFWRADLSYRDNELEAEAYDVEAEVLSCLRNGGC